MTPDSLAICFAMSLCKPPGSSTMNNMGQSLSLIKNCIMHVGDVASSPGSPLADHQPSAITFSASKILRSNPRTPFKKKTKTWMTSSRTSLQVTTRHPQRPKLAQVSSPSKVAQSSETTSAARSKPARRRPASLPPPTASQTATKIPIPSACLYAVLFSTTPALSPLDFQPLLDLFLFLFTPPPPMDFSSFLRSLSHVAVCAKIISPSFCTPRSLSAAFGTLVLLIDAVDGFLCVIEAEAMILGRCDNIT